jgi:hypothetical protein
VGKHVTELEMFRAVSGIFQGAQAIFMGTFLGFRMISVIRGSFVVFNPLVCDPRDIVDTSSLVSYKVMFRKSSKIQITKKNWLR